MDPTASTLGIRALKEQHCWDAANHTTSPEPAMSTQPPQLALTAPLPPAPPLSISVAAYGRVTRKDRRKSRRASAARDEYIANPLKMFDHIVIHPVAWPSEALRWMGVPRTLPVTPSTAGAELEQAAISAALRLAYKSVAEQIARGHKVAREDLSSFVIEAFASFAAARKISIYSRAKAYLSLGDLRVRVEPKHGFSGRGVVPALAYLDEPFRKTQREKAANWRSTRKECREVCQDDHNIDVMDVVLLLAMAQEHRRWGVPPDAWGNHTTRVMYPSEKGETMIVLTAVTPAETLAGIHAGHDTLKRITYTRRTYAVVGANEREVLGTNPLLQLISAVVDEAGSLAEKTPTPRWPIGPWAWTTHF
ncbi:hypothetical protein C8Q79DRAFT_980838 [Trametes meyenii]|nr:hypothetical protein C8Q79DRAFT_980838 [Trametes meyenii]